MSYTIIKKLPPIETLLQELPLEDTAASQISENRKEIKRIISGQDSRLLMIVGPCSAWPSEAVIEYAEKLKTLSDQIKDVIKIVMRVYIQKPRTTKGWTGPLNQPDPFAYPDIEAGIRYVRSMMLKVINLGLPIADEALFTHAGKGFIELLSWIAVGARSSEDQEHRIYASSLDCAVGLKNPTHGNLKIAVNGILAAQHPHVAIFDGYEVQTHGNAHAHLVLRGGNGEPNYSNEHLKTALHLMHMNEINHPAVIIDASHDNSLVKGRKDFRRQTEIIHEVLDSIQDNPELKTFVKGFMMESFLLPGHQSLTTASPETLNRSGLSITDPCLDWDNTEILLLSLAERLRS